MANAAAAAARRRCRAAAAAAAVRIVGVGRRRGRGVECRRRRCRWSSQMWRSPLPTVRELIVVAIGLLFVVVVLIGGRRVRVGCNIVARRDGGGGAGDDGGGGASETRARWRRLRVGQLLANVGEHLKRFAVVVGRGGGGGCRIFHWNVVVQMIAIANARPRRVVVNRVCARRAADKRR